MNRWNLSNFKGNSNEMTNEPLLRSLVRPRGRHRYLLNGRIPSTSPLQRIPEIANSFRPDMSGSEERNANDFWSENEELFGHISDHGSPKMPDISRSDSNRSDASRPRVSFNRDVHVKRINGPRTANAYSLSSDGTSFVPTSIRRERPKTKKEMTKEAEVVLKQVDKVSCTATSNLNLDQEDRPKKKKKKRKDSFSFLKKLDRTKTSSSDYDSGSSQEYRIYQVNGPANNSINNSNKCIDSVRMRKNQNKTYDFMSLDRKKLRKEKKNRNLEYLSLERNNDIFDKMKKEKPKTLLSTVFDKIDVRTRKATTTTPPTAEVKDTAKPKPKITIDVPDEQAKKKQLSPIIESPVADYFDRKGAGNVDRMVRKLSEKVIPKLSANTGTLGMREPHSDTCHNDNKPFSYTSGDKGESKSDRATAEGLGNGKEDLKSTSPTNDVIYAQVIVGGRDGNAQKATVNERVASNEVGRVFVGDESNQSQVGLNYKSDSNPNDGVCEIVAVDGDEMWQARSDYVGKKEKTEGSRMPQTELYGENPGRRDLFRRPSVDSEGTSPSPTRDDFTRVIKVAPKYDPVRRAPADLHDLSIRREILLSRSESQAKERFNSLKRLQEPARLKRHVSNVNGLRPQDTVVKNDIRSLADDIDINHKFATSLRKVPRDVELLEPAARKKRESKLDAHLKEKDKDDKFKTSDKGHVIVTDDDDNLLRKLTRLGKSKTSVQDKPKNKKMDKVKMLFMKKKEGRSSDSEDDLASRYIEYRGSDVETSDRSTDSSPRRMLYRTETTAPLESSYSGRKKIPTPMPYDAMGTLTKIKNDRNKESHWLKPLEKMGKKGKQKNKVDDGTSEITNSPKQTSLRFFGDTDQESTTNDVDLADAKSKYGLYRGGKMSDSDDDPLTIPSRPESRMTDSTLKGSSTGRHKSKYDLDRPDYGLKQMNHGLQMSSIKNDTPSESSTLKNDSYDINGLKYGPSVMRSSSSVTSTAKYGQKEKLRNLKSTPTTSVTTPEEPLSRRVKSHGNLYSQDDGKRGGRRRLYESSADSATEGDSSQHSSKSMIYLHAATVGDIPGPRNVYKSERRSQSREELSSIGDTGVFAPGKKTLSRSISVLAPWRPKHNKEDRTLHYDSVLPAVDYSKGKPPTGMGKNKRSTSRERKHNELRFNTIGKESRKRKDLLR